MRHLLACAAILLAAPLLGCGDNRKVNEGDVDATVADAPDIDAVPIDARPVDAAIDANCPARAAGTVGGTCISDAQCDSATGAGDGFCLRGAQGSIVWPTEGYCVNQIDSCTVNSCGAGNQCTTIDDPLGAFRACMPACGADPCICSNGQICATGFSGSDLGAGQMACLPGNAASIDGAACTGFGECAQDSLCQNNAFEFPGGMCGRIGCTIGNDSTCAAGGDGHCVDLAQITAGFNTGTICVDRCVSDTDCRQGEGYRCVDGGGTIGKYCRHPQIGDTCTMDAQCDDAVGMRCGFSLPGGFCTVRQPCPTPGSSQGCAPLSSICWDGPTPADLNFCVDRCGGPENTQGGCRAGLTCRDVDPLGGPTHVFLGCIAP